MFESRKGCSKAEKDVLKRDRTFQNSFFGQFQVNFDPKVCKLGSHIARPKTSRTHAHSAHFSEWISLAHAHVRPHIARVHTHLRNSCLDKQEYLTDLFCANNHGIPLQMIRVQRENKNFFDRQKCKLYIIKLLNCLESPFILRDLYTGNTYAI